MAAGLHCERVLHLFFLIFFFSLSFQFHWDLVHRERADPNSDVSTTGRVQYLFLLFLLLFSFFFFRFFFFFFLFSFFPYFL